MSMDCKVDVKELIKDIVSAPQPDPLVDRNEDVKSLIKELAAVSLWSLLDLPNLSLKNSLNKCWFHAGLHLLTCSQSTCAVFIASSRR